MPLGHGHKDRALPYVVVNGVVVVVIVVVVVCRLKSLPMIT